MIYNASDTWIKTPFLLFIVANDLDFNSTAEISEEEQIRLLNEYQKEMEAEKEQQQELATKDNHYAENTVSPILNEKGIQIFDN